MKSLSLLCSLILSPCFVAFKLPSLTNSQNEDQHLYSSKDALMDLLFANRTRILNTRDRNDIKNHLRQLKLVKQPYDPLHPPVCVTCTGLSSCSIVNNKMIEETYLPEDKGARETCKVLESTAKRLSQSIFGNGRTFRDTPQCREIAMQYLCLFFASDNTMYQNYCQDDFTDVNLPLITPKPPCKSFCVQVATTCANSPEFILLCNDIQCPPVTEEACEPDPYINGVPVGANLDCEVPYYKDPYAPKNTAVRTTLSISVVMLVIFLCSLLQNMVF